MEIKVEDFPVTKDINWQEVAGKIGVENTIWFLDNYGSDDRKWIISAATVRNAAKKRARNVPRDTAGILP